MPIIITPYHISRLIQIESNVHYYEKPPLGHEPFIVLDRHSTVLLSAPHGAVAYRNTHYELWHDEDEYTAGLALLLSELCNISVIASIWRTENSDPNYSTENESSYKKKIRELVNSGVRWVIDLHGSGEFTQYLAQHQLIDIGLGPNAASLPPQAAQSLQDLIEKRLGPGVTDRQGKRGFPAAEPGRTITAFASRILGIYAVQIEMKPSVRVAERRVDGSGYRKKIPEGGPYHAPQQNLIGMMQALVDFIEMLNHQE